MITERNTYDYGGEQRAHLHATNNLCLTLTLLPICAAELLLCAVVLDKYYAFKPRHLCRKLLS